MISTLKISIPAIEIIATMGKFAFLPIRISDIGRINKMQFADAFAGPSKNLCLTSSENTFLVTTKFIR